MLEVFNNNLGSKEQGSQPAIQFESKISLTHDYLNKITTEQAIYLKQQGVKKGDRVGVLLPRGPGQIKAALAIWKAGAVYIPMTDRTIATMCKDAQVKNVIAKEELALEDDIDVSFINLDQAKADENNNHSQQIDAKQDDDDVICIFSTSGTTGTVKCVPIIAKGYDYWWHVMRDKLSEYTNSDSRILANCATSFDASLWEWQMAWTFGATLNITSEQTRTNPQRLLEFIDEHKITHATLIPTQIRSLIKEENCVKQLSSLKAIFTTGEACTVDIVKFCQENGIKLINCYGSTEETYGHSIVEVIEDNISKHEQVPIGQAYNPSNYEGEVKEYLVDENNNEVKGDGRGELYVASPHLTPGYLNFEKGSELEENKQRFIEMKIDGEDVCLFKTGDMVLREGAHLYYLNRTECGHVKIKGEKVHYQPIENALCEHPSINDACVIVNDNQRQTKLRAFIVKGKDDDNLTRNEIYQYLKKKNVRSVAYPEIVFCESLPLNANGKVDREQIRNRAKGPDHKTKIIIEPEQLLLEIWQRILNTNDINYDLCFEYNGGSSLEHSQMFSEIEKQFEIDIPRGEFITNEQITIRKLAEVIYKLRCKKDSDKPLELIEVGDVARYLYLVPPITGESFNTYKPMCKELMESFSRLSKPYLYAIKQRGLDDPMDVTQSLDLSAKDIAEAIIKKQPVGNINLLGWSFGATLALKIREKLKELGREVSYIGLIDGTHPKELQEMDNKKFATKLEGIVFALIKEMKIHYAQGIEVNNKLDKVEQVDQLFGPILEYLSDNSDKYEFNIFHQAMCNIKSVLNVSLELANDKSLHLYDADESSDSKDDDRPEKPGRFWKVGLECCNTYEADHFSIIKNPSILKLLCRDVSRDFMDTYPDDELKTEESEITNMKTSHVLFDMLKNENGMRKFHKLDGKVVLLLIDKDDIASEDMQCFSGVGQCIAIFGRTNQPENDDVKENSKNRGNGIFQKNNGSLPPKKRSQSVSDIDSAKKRSQSVSDLGSYGRNR